MIYIMSRSSDERVERPKSAPGNVLKSILLEVPPMHGQVTAKLIRSCEPLGAVGPGAYMGLLSGVRTHVRLEVVGSGELALADVALEWAYPRVLAAVPPQLVRAGESLATALVLADVRLFAGVLPDVHLEVGQLEVALCASRVEADKWFSLLLCLGDGVLLTDERALLLHVRSDLRHDERRVGRHCHLSGRGTVVLKVVCWHALKVGRNMLWGIADRNCACLVGRVGKGEDRGGAVGGREVLERHRARLVEAHV